MGQQILTLAGVLLGAFATFVVTTLNERGRWRRAMATRWDDARLTAYSEYGDALSTATHLVHRMAAARGLPAGAQAMDVDEGLPLLAEVEQVRASKWQTVLLLGDPATIAAAREWQESVWDLSWIARGRDVTKAEYIALYEEAGRRRDAFYVAARSDLGVTSGELPRSDAYRRRLSDEVGP